MGCGKKTPAEKSQVYTDAGENWNLIPAGQFIEQVKVSLVIVQFRPPLKFNFSILQLSASKCQNILIN